MSAGQHLSLPVEQLRRYERDPRRGVNPKYEQIKESIREQGITNRLTVTRRPGEDLYFPFAGGNTRLQAVQELWRETGDARFASLDVVYREWPGEAACIAAHLSENNNRGDPAFWDNACGLWDLKLELERGTGRALSSSDLAGEAKTLGMDFGRTSVLTLLFAREMLEPLGPWLTFGAVHKVIKPEILSLQGICRHLDLSPIDAHQAVSIAVASYATLLRTRAASHPSGTMTGFAVDGGERLLDVGELVADIRRSIARALGFSPASLEAALQLRVEQPELPSAELRTIVQARTGASHVLNGEATAASARAPIAPADGGGNAANPMSAAAATLGAPVAPATQKATGGRMPLELNTPNLAQSQTASNAMAAAAPIVERASRIQLVTAICEQVGLTHLLREDESAPFRYFMELPPDPIATIRQHVIWLVMAAISGQCTQARLSGLPSHSAWRCAIDGSADPDAAARQAMAEAFVVPAITPLDLHHCFSDVALRESLRQLFVSPALDSIHV